MRKVQKAAFISDAGLYVALPSHLHGGTPLHLPASTFAFRMARQHRDHAMAGKFPAIYRREESLRIRDICTLCRPHPARVHRGKFITCLGESLCGRPPAIWTYPGSHWTVCCCTTVLRSSCSRFSLEQDMRSAITPNLMSPLVSPLHILSRRSHLVPPSFTPII